MNILRNCNLFNGCLEMAKNREGWSRATFKVSLGASLSNYRLPTPPAEWKHFTLWPSEVAQPFEGQGQLDSNETEVMGSCQPLEPNGKVHRRGVTDGQESPVLLPVPQLRAGSSFILRMGLRTEGQPSAPRDSQPPRWVLGSICDVPGPSCVPSALWVLTTISTFFTCNGEKISPLFHCLSAWRCLIFRRMDL